MWPVCPQDVGRPWCTRRSRHPAPSLPVSSVLDSPCPLLQPAGSPFASPCLLLQPAGSPFASPCLLLQSAASPCRQSLPTAAAGEVSVSSVPALLQSAGSPFRQSPPTATAGRVDHRRSPTTGHPGAHHSRHARLWYRSQEQCFSSLTLCVDWFPVW